MTLRVYDVVSGPGPAAENLLKNGAVIGEECLVGAGTLVPEGKVYPARSLILGSPGRVMRTLVEEDIARMRRTVQGYQARWKRYVAGLEAMG